MTRRAFAYFRCSTTDQDRSIGDQQAEVRAYAAREGITIVREFVDEGLSGAEHERPGFLSLMAAVREEPRQADCILVWAMNRLYRDEVGQILTVRELDTLGVPPLSITDPLPADQGTRQLMLSIMAAIDAHHLTRLKVDVPRGLRRTASEGRWVFGTPPYGYRSEHDKPDRAGRLVVNEQEAEVVQAIFDDYLAGDGAQAVAQRMTRAGHAPPSRSDTPRARHAQVWTRKHIRTIVTNKVYTGVIVYKDDVVAEDAHPAIITEDLFERAQAVRRQRHRRPRGANRRRTGERGLFTPWLRCATCLGKMRVNRGGTRDAPIYYYACASRIENTDLCPGINGRIDIVDPLLRDAISHHILTEDALRAAARRQADAMAGGQQSRLASIRAEHQRASKTSTEAIGRLVKLAAAGVIQDDELAPELHRLREQRDAAEDALRALPREVPAVDPDRIDVAALRESILRAWDERSIEDRRDALAVVLREVRLYPNYIHLYFRPGPPGDGHGEIEPMKQETAASDSGLDHQAPNNHQAPQAPA